MPEFDKYQRSGAYHWRQVDRSRTNSAFNPPLLARYAVLAGKLPRRAGTLLDVGCGDGYLLAHAHQHNRHLALYGVDTDAAGIALAHQHLQQHGCSATLLHGSSYALPLPPACMDVVTMADVIEHLERPHHALHEIRRVVRSGGVLLLSTPNRQPGGAWDHRHIHEYDAVELHALLSLFFATVEVVACWPMWWFRQWNSGGRKRRLINALARNGCNPFALTTQHAFARHGQLIVRATA
jgi:SAM-dependent methyltransferase